jgi:hypothetical protein
MAMTKQPMMSTQTDWEVSHTIAPSLYAVPKRPLGTFAMLREGTLGLGA